MYKKKYSEILYICILGFWYSTEIFFSTTLKFVFGIPIDVLSNLVSFLVFALLMLQILFMQSYTKRELILIGFITVPIMISTLISGNRSLLSLWMFVVGAKRITFDRIIQIAYRILLIMIPLVVVLRFVGIIADYTMMRGSIQRFSLGFSHPNQLGLRIFQLALCQCYVNREKINIWNYCNITLAILFVIKVPNSQTAYICLIVFLILLIIYEFIRNQKQLLIKLYTDGLLVGTILLYIISMILSFIDVNRNSVLRQIDRWMSQRFSWGHKVWQIYGTSLLGQKIYVSEKEVRLIGLNRRLWLDNAYMSLFLRYGVITFLIFSCFYIYLIYKKIEKKQYILAIILFLYALYGMMETGLYMVTHNIFLIAFADLLYHKKGIAE